ncbi:MAG: TonB family protein [Myxococcota bacterium]|jgi:TonB family protein
MYRWTLPLIAFIALATTATAEDPLNIDQFSDSGAPDVEVEFTPWADKVIIDTRSRVLRFVWLDSGESTKVSFSKISQLTYLPAYQGSDAELVVTTTGGDRHLMVKGSTARQDAAVIAAIIARPLETIAASDEHVSPPELAQQAGPRLTLGAANGPFAMMGLGEPLEEDSGFGNVTDTITYAAPAGFTSASDGQGEMERSNIALGIRAKMGVYKGCYQRQLQRSPNLQGTVTVEFIIDEVGVVSRARVASSSLGNEQVEKCLVQNLEGSQFPNPRGGTVVVTYPFNFTRG